MNNVDRTSQSRSKFFPNSNTKPNRLNRTGIVPRKNTSDRQQQLQKIAEKDAKITIPESVKDFAKIKKAVDAAPPIDNAKKIADLKARIKSGNYQVDFEGVADKILQQEF